MEQQLNELTNLLGRHLIHYQELNALLEQEQAALIALEFERLQEVAKAKETTVLAINDLVPVLTLGIKKAAACLGLTDHPLPTLSDISGAAPQPWSSRLNRASLNLARLKKNAVRHNEANRSFVQEALDLLSGSIAILTGAAMVHQEGYRSNGQRALAATAGPTKLSREV